jgi:acyl carrier protein
MSATAPDDTLDRLVIEALLTVTSRGRSSLTSTSSLADLFPDSLTAVAFAAELEDRLGREVPFDQWLMRNATRMASLTVADLVAFVRDER